MIQRYRISVLFSCLTSLTFVTTRPIMQAWWHSLLQKFLPLTSCFFYYSLLQKYYFSATWATDIRKKVPPICWAGLFLTSFVGRLFQHELAAEECEGEIFNTIFLLL